jgi:hypothetical protein
MLDARDRATGSMSYLSCPRCRLTIRIRAPYLVLRNCPRCLARAGLPTPMYVSAGPNTPVPAVDEHPGIAPKPVNAGAAGARRST